jgi:uncharacterized protein (DUF2141 family)
MWKNLMAILFIITICFAGKPVKKVTIIIENLQNKKGTLYIGWYSEKQNFRKPDKAVFNKKVAVMNASNKPVEFNDVPEGTYAVAVFLDENDNGKIDTNVIGIPKEKYGFSNNKFPLTRAANFNEAAFMVNEQNNTINIRLK